MTPHASEPAPTHLAAATRRRAVDAPDPDLALVTRGLTQRFGDKLALDALDLDVPAGSFFGVVGPNGAGKTT
ncbi:hypothetical protein V2S84_27705, partial [Azotobacter chroococcum]|nr:hypothetical protein [Azotobacter chroococcum]